MKKRLYQKGFAALEAILILTVIGTIGGAGWYVLNSKDKIAKTYDSSKNQDLIGAFGPYNRGKDTFKTERIGVKVTFVDTKIFTENARKEVFEKVVDPMVYYNNKVMKGDLMGLTIFESDGDYYESEDYKGEGGCDGCGGLFARSGKIQYWVPQLCDDGGCQSYPKDLKEKYPKNYEAYQKANEDLDKNPNYEVFMH